MLESSAIAKLGFTEGRMYRVVKTQELKNKRESNIFKNFEANTVDFLDTV